MTELRTVIEKDHKFYFNTFGDRIPVCFTSGKGMFIYDTDGGKYMDLLGGIAVNVLGHGNDVLVAAITEQASKLIHCSNLYYIGNQSELAERLVGLAPGMDRVFFANSGAEANEGAIKLARAFFYKKGKPRSRIVTALNSFHGRTLATVTATGQEKYSKPFAPLPEGFVHIPYNDPAAAIEIINDDTCAVMLELIQGESGIVPASEEFVSAVSAACRKHGALLIIDEIQSGMGRTGTFFAYEQYGIMPDIVTLAKGLGGGVPIGALLANEETAGAFVPGDHGTTFGGNPLVCAASLAVLDEYSAKSLVDNASDMGRYFIEKLQQIRDPHGVISEVRGKGLMIGIVLRDGGAAEMKMELFNRGYLVNSVGASVLRLLPPLIISKADIDDFCRTLETIIGK